MKARSIFCLVVVSALPLVVACGSDSSDPATTATAGSGGTASGGSGGTASGGTAGTGGGSGGSGGSGGASAGTGGAAAGAAGSSGTLVDLAGCTEATATDKTGGSAVVTAGVGGFKYSPACIKVKLGSTIDFKGNSATHPLVGMTTAGTQPNPIGAASTADKTVTFDAEGTFGFFCANHGGDGSGSGMVGAVYVVP